MDTPKKLPDLSEEEINELAKEAREWAKSPEGQEALKKVIEYTEEVFGPDDQCNCPGCGARRIREASNRMGPIGIS